MSQEVDKVDIEDGGHDGEEDTGRRRSTRARAPPAATVPAPKKDPKATKGAKKGAAKKDPKSKKGGKKKDDSEDEDSVVEIADDKMEEEEEIQEKKDKEDKDDKDDDFDDNDDNDDEPSEDDEEEEDDFEDKPKKKGKGAPKTAPAKKGKAADKPEKAEKKAPATKAPAAKGKKKAKESDDEDDFNDDSEEAKPKGKGGAAKKGAPAGKKGKKDEDDGVAIDDDVVVEYMKKANRPYSLINIFDNMHGKIKKPALQKMLDGLVSKNKLTCKEFGKAKIYLMNQNLLPQVDKHELESMQNELNEKRVYLREIGDEIKELTKKIGVFNKQLTDTQIEEEIVKCEKNIHHLDDKMQFYQSDKFVQASDSEVKKYEDNYQKMEKEYKRRRRMCKDGIGQIAEGMNKKLADVKEDIGIEEEDE